MRSREGSESAASQTKQGIESSRDTDNPYNVEDSSPLYPAKSASEFYRARPVRNRRIHILGVGNVGTFIAHALRGIPNPPPVTLIFNHEGKLRQWEKSNKTLSLVTDGTIEARDGYDVELAIPRRRYHGKEMGEEDNTKELENESASEPPKPQTLEGESNEPIHSLIVCSKTPYVLQALSAVKHRLHKHSVVLFLQNGMGTVEEVNREIFQDPATRPYYMIGVNSHGMHASKEHQFTSVHAGFGTISLGILPHERYRKSAPYAPLPKFHGSQEGPVKQGSEQHAARSEEGLELTPPPTSTSFNWTPHERYLLRTLLRTPVLSAASFSPPDLLQMQLEKLAVNCIINPLTVMVDARNGSILYNYSLTRVIRLLLSEISLVIRSLPELQYIPNVEQRFDPGRLETIVVGVAQKTRNNISSMLADARVGRLTEIDYINGWIVRKGEEQGIRCVMNYMMLHLVKGKKQIIEMELQEATPLVTPGGGGVEIKMDESVRPVE